MAIKRGVWGDLKWNFACSVYGEEIAKQLYTIPGSFPTSLMDAKEETAFNLLIALYNKQEFDLKNLNKISQEESKKELEAMEEANEILDMRREPNVQKWQVRLEHFKNNIA